MKEIYAEHENKPQKLIEMVRPEKQHGSQHSDGPFRYIHGPQEISFPAYSKTKEPD